MPIPKDIIGASVAETRKYRADLAKKAQALVTHANAEGRDLNPEEAAQFDSMMQDVDDLKGRVDRLEQLNQIEENGEADSEREEGDEPEERSWRRHRDGERRTRPMEIESRGYERSTTSRHASPEYRRMFEHYIRTGERRDTVLGTDSQGGYLVVPYVMADEVVQQIKNLTFMRGLAKVKNVAGKNLRIPQLTARISDFAWTGEVGNVSKDTSQTFGARDLTPTVVAKLATVSIQELMVEPNVEGLITDQLGYKYAVTEENGFLNGDGTSGQPLGVFTADASGIPASTDTPTASSGTFVSDDLISARYALKQPYLNDPTARWIFHRDIVGKIRKMKDQYGQYLWTAGIAGKAPDTVLDIPVCISEYAPNTLSSGNYIGILGAFSYYWIAEQQPQLTIQRLVELYAGNNEIGFIGRRFIDGAPALGEAFTRIKVA